MVQIELFNKEELQKMQAESSLFKNVKVSKRDGREVLFDAERIYRALQKAYISVYGENEDSISKAFEVSNLVIEKLKKKINNGQDKFAIEEIQDEVEPEKGSDLENLGLKVEPTYDTEKVVEEVTNYVQAIIDDMDVEGTISSTSNRRSINMQIDTNEPGRIIGYHGKVLKSLQLLAQNYLYNRYSKTFYITINVNDYVEHRAEVLQSYAQKLATRVLEEGRSQMTDPMSSSERKIIHRIISRMEGVTSYSEGDEPNRYVVVDTE